MQPKKNTKRQTQGPTGLYELFSVNCAHWRGSTLAIYKTVLIIFPLNLLTITIILYAVKWRGGGINGVKPSGDIYRALRMNCLNQWNHLCEMSKIPYTHITINSHYKWTNQIHTQKMPKKENSIPLIKEHRPTDSVFPRPIQCANMHPDPSSVFSCCSDSTQQFHMNLTAAVNQQHTINIVIQNCTSLRKGYAIIMEQILQNTAPSEETKVF